MAMATLNCLPSLDGALSFPLFVTLESSAYYITHEHLAVGRLASALWRSRLTLAAALIELI